jgi:hypothetical protein
VDGPALGVPGNAVQHGVLDQRLQDERRHANLVEPRLDLDGVAQPIAEARPLYLQVIDDHLDLARERNRIGRRARQHLAQQAGQPLHRLLGESRLLRDQAGDRVE